MKFIVACFTLMFLLLVSIQAFTQKDALKNPTIISVVLTTPKNVLIGFSNGQKMYIDFYGETIFRVFMDPGGAKPHNPIANPPAQILVDNPSKQLSALSKLEVGNQLTVANKSLSILFDKI